MNRTKSFAILAVLSAVVLATPLAFAWQSYAVSGDGPVFIQSPSKPAFYRRVLVGQPQAFQFDIVGAPSRVQIQFFVPDEEGIQKDITAALVSRDNPDAPIVTFDPLSSQWNEKFYDTKASLHFLKGPVAKQLLEAGQYELRVWSSNNEGAYAISMGDLAGEIAEEQQALQEEAREESRPDVDPGFRNIVIIGIIAAIGVSIWLASRKTS